MIPLLIGAAAVGLAGLALSGDDKKNSTTTTTREIPPSEVPPDVREKLGCVHTIELRKINE